MKRNFVNGLNSGKRKRDPQLELPIWSKVEAVAQVGRLLLEGGYRRPAQLVDDEVSLAQRFVDLANRCIRKETTESDNNRLKQLRQTKECLGVGSRLSTCDPCKRVAGCDAIETRRGCARRRLPLKLALQTRS